MKYSFKVTNLYHIVSGISITSGLNHQTPVRSKSLMTQNTNEILFEG